MFRGRNGTLAAARTTEFAFDRNAVRVVSVRDVGTEAGVSPADTHARAKS
jgi:hypothetical protein